MVSRREKGQRKLQRDRSFPFIFFLRFLLNYREFLLLYFYINVTRGNLTNVHPFVFPLSPFSPSRFVRVLVLSFPSVFWFM